MSTKQRIKCLAQGHNIVTPSAVRLKPATLRSPEQHFDPQSNVLPTEPTALHMFVLFDLILYVPINNFSVMSGWVFLG